MCQQYDHFEQGVDFYVATIINILDSSGQYDHFSEKEIVRARSVVSRVCRLDVSSLKTTFVWDFDDACTIVGYGQDGYNRCSLRLLKNRFVDEFGDTMRDDKLNLRGFIRLCSIVARSNYKKMFMYDFIRELIY